MTKDEIAARKLELVEKQVPLGELMGTGKTHAPRKLDIACGKAKTPGYKGIDISGDADITHDLFTFPWPIKTSSVHEVVCNHFLEHVPHRIDDSGVDGFFLFFDELHRVMKPGGTAVFRHPYVWNDRAFWDPTHVRFIHEANYWYLSKGWRIAQGLDHYPVSCDFEVLTTGFSYFTQDMQTRPPEYQEWARTHLKNAVGDLEVTVKALK